MRARGWFVGSWLCLAACEPSPSPALVPAPIAPIAPAPPSPPVPPPAPEAAPGSAAEPAADRCAPLARGNWTVEWSAYVTRETSFAGKPMKVLSPAPGAHRLVRDADATPAGAGAGLLGVSKGALATIFDATLVPLNVGEIVEREVPGDTIAAACVVGTTARVYWTKPHAKVRSEAGRTTREAFSTLFIEGIHAGESTLRLRLADGASRSIPLVVTEPPHKRR